MLNPADYPARPFDVLFHVGSLDPAAKKSQSYEGQGLSVSVHPEDWAAIARLGGSPTWALTKDGGALLDHHALSPEQSAAITAWGVTAGYVEPVTVWSVSWYDEELDSTVAMLCTTIEEARAEAEEICEVYETEDGDAVVPVPVAAHAATAAFPDATVTAGDLNPFEPLAALWVSAHRPDLDGVWFEDRYAPELLSCPRGVIAPDRVAGWAARVVAEPVLR